MWKEQNKSFTPDCMDKGSSDSSYSLHINCGRSDYIFICHKIYIFGISLIYYD